MVEFNVNSHYPFDSDKEADDWLKEIKAHIYYDEKYIYIEINGRMIICGGVIR